MNQWPASPTSLTATGSNINGSSTTTGASGTYFEVQTYHPENAKNTRLQWTVQIHFILTKKPSTGLGAQSLKLNSLLPRRSLDRHVVNGSVEQIGCASWNRQSVLDQISSISFVGLLDRNWSVSSSVDGSSLHVHAANMEVGAALVTGLNEEVEVFDEGVRVVSAGFNSDGLRHVLDVNVIQSYVN